MKNEKNALFIQTLVEMFPDVATSKVVTTKQLDDVVKQIRTTSKCSTPYWLMENKVARGTYDISSELSTVDNVVKIQPQSPKAVLPVKSNPINVVGMIPESDPTFVPFGNFKDMELIVKSGIFYPTYIYGPTGNGKSTMVEQICAKYKKPLIRVNLNMMTDEEQLIGSKTLVEGNIEIVEGPVLIAMRTGTTLLLDEIDAGSANTLLCLQPILEGKPYYFKLKNEMIVPASGFNIVATANTKGKGSDDGRYIGTNVLNEAFLERFAVTLEQEYPNDKVELNIVKNLMEQFNCMDEKFAGLLVKWASAIRKTFDDGGVDELITTRRMVHIVRAYSIFKDKQKAVELCCNRFDSQTKVAFLDLLKKLDEPEEVVMDDQAKEFFNQEVPF